MNPTEAAERHAVIDCQVHAYERDHPGRPWVGTLAGPLEVTGDDMVTAMDAVGVDGALLVSPWSMYRYDPSYALEVFAKHPTRFGLIRPFDPRSAAVGEEFVEWVRQPGVVGGRIMMSYEEVSDEETAGIDAILSAGAAAGVPVNILCWNNPGALAALAERHPDTQIVIDHVGLKQPFEPPAPQVPFAGLDAVIGLSRYQNVAIKISGACTLSHEPYPFIDIWAPLARVFDAYGLERCLWGTDWTRAVELLNYGEGVFAFRTTASLSDSDRAMLMGGALERIYRWRPGPA
ncbi:MAG: amidohydrolase family protein [Pseudomonadota bacterium]